jgi:hypothetical protein
MQREMTTPKCRKLDKHLFEDLSEDDVFLLVGNFLSSPYVTHFCVTAVAQELFRNKNLGNILQHLLLDGPSKGMMFRSSMTPQ